MGGGKDVAWIVSIKVKGRADGIKGMPHAGKSSPEYQVRVVKWDVRSTSSSRV